jgi:PTH1 family peptidyl-tRNA hydrolase
MDTGHLIVGLGNPGARYRRTRHNAGFMVVEQLAARWKTDWTDEKKFQARVAQGRRNGGPVWLCQPQTFMNLSGETVAAMLGFYQLPPERLLVVVDDADLPLGGLRLRPAGSSGGHHGLESIERQLGTQATPRLRVGIGRAAGAREISNYVLGKFAADDQDLWAKVLTVAADQAECWLDAGIATAMNQYNGVVNPGNENIKT